MSLIRHIKHSPRVIITWVFVLSVLPFLAVELFRAQFYHVMDISSYLVFHNIAEFFSVMVSLSIFGVGWYTYEQSKDSHALFLSAAFLAIGIMDFMHALGYAGMPAFITPNSANKSTQFWIAARSFAAVAFLVSAYIHPDTRRNWLSKPVLLASGLAASGLVFIAVTFFPSDLPATFIEGVGLTPFKEISEYLIIGLLIFAALAYWRRFSSEGDRQLLYYIAAFIICIFSELAFAGYESVFDTFNVLGHIYKIAAFGLVYVGIFTVSVKSPYLKLMGLSEELRKDIAERIKAEATIIKAKKEWEHTFDSITDPIMILDTNHRIVKANKAMADKLGVTVSEATGMTCYRSIHGTGEPPPFCPHSKLLADGQPHSSEILEPRLGGHFLISVSPIYDSEGRLSGSVHYARDISARKRAEEKLRKEAERGSILLELYEKAPQLTEKELYDYALDQVVYLTDSEIGFFHLVSDDQKTVILTTWNSEALKNCTASYATHYSINEAGNWVDCVRHRRPIIYNDFPTSPNQKGLPEGHSPVRRFMSIPVMEGEKVRFIFGVGNKVEEYDDLDVAHIQLVANELQDIIRQRRAEEEIRQLATIVESSDDAIIGKTPEGVVLTWNKGAERVYSYAADEIVGRPISLLAPPEMPDEIPGIMERLKRGEVIRHYETERMRKDGSRLFVSLSISPLRNAAGEIVGASAIARDITERKKTEHDLVRMLFALNHVSEEVLILDDHARIHFVNEAACRSLGYSREELLKLGISDIDPDFQMDVWPGHWHEVKDKGSLWFESRHRARDGRIYPVQISSDYFEYEGHGYIFGTARDITEYKKVEKTLSEQRRILDSFFSYSVTPLVILDRKFNFIRVNEAYARACQRDISEFTGHNHFEFYPSDARMIFERVVQSKEPFQAVARPFVFPDHPEWGTTYWDWTLTPILDSANEVEFLVFSLMDVTDNKRAEERIQRQLQRLSSLRSIDLAISSSLDIRVTFRVFIDHVITQLSVDAVNVLLLNPRSGLLEYTAHHGFRTDALRHSHVRLGEGYAGIAALENRIVSVPDLTKEDTGFTQLGLLEGEDFVTYFGVPLVAKGRVKGVLEIFHRSRLEPDEEWFEFLGALALQAAIAIDNSSLFNDLERSNMDLSLAYDSTIEGWSRALDYRDKETEGHSQRVTEMTIKIAREMGINEDELVNARRGALLHDMGKLGIPDAVLLKAGPLTEEEWKIMRQHPVYAYDLLYPIAYLRPALDIPYCHHEKWDGSGYPRGLMGEQIPLCARIFAVVDVWDALRSNRPYRPAWSEEKAREYIISLSGIQFDPKVVEIFIRTVAKKKDE